MRPFAFGRRSRWRRTLPTGLVPPLPPPRRSPAADGASTEAHAAPGSVARTARPVGEPPTSRPGGQQQQVAEQAAPPVTAPPGPLSGQAQGSPSPAWPKPTVATAPSEGDGTVGLAAGPGPRQSRIRVLHSASELDDARARAPAQLERIEAAMQPVVRRQQRASGGGE